MWGWETHVHDEEVQPAPCVGEVLDEAVGHPLEQHLQDEDVGEDAVGVLQDDLDGLPLLDVHVLEGLEERHTPTRTHTHAQPNRYTHAPAHTHTHTHTKFKANGLHYMVYSEHGILI